MAVYDYGDDDDVTTDSELPKKLRAEIKRLQKENADWQEKYEGLYKETRTRTLQEQISSRGLNPKIAAFIPPDADVDAWLTEYGDVFGAAQPQTPPDPALEQAKADAQRMSQVEQGATPAPNNILAQIESAQSVDELMAVLRATG